MTPAATAARPRRLRRSRGGIALPRCDGRTLAARRYRSLIESFEAELGAPVSEVDRNLIQQAANLVLASERLQADVVQGVQIDPDALVRVSSEARRILNTLKSKAAKNKPTGPDLLQQYLASKAAQQTADEPEGDQGS